ncbi:MAG: hypothetical protein H5U38_08975 [Calditrichaeota bacterium]|nr:hypothetical protein [Calditrichota bacterium]
MGLLLLCPATVPAGERIRGEIILKVTGTGSYAWWWEWEGDAARWWTDYRLTNLYGFARSKERQRVGINCPEQEQPGAYNVAWGRYSFRFCCPDLLDTAEEFALDLTDPRWALRQPPYPSPIDLYIRWNHDLRRFEYRLQSEGPWVELPREATIWGLWGVGRPGPEVVGVFEPTPPAWFYCTNAGEDGQNPHFFWGEPQPAGVSYWYNVSPGGG